MPSLSKVRGFDSCDICSWFLCKVKLSSFSPTPKSELRLPKYTIFKYLNIFFLSIVITRWWAQYKTIPWPDSCCLFISTCILGHDDRWVTSLMTRVIKTICRGRLMRRTIARYLILALIQALRMTSIQVY